MFRWLTRNDGARIGRAKRRLKSSRASVYTEFALIMPIVVLVCSALIEIVGLWDAQVMANHAAWTVGRIVMVRGSDGLVFSEDVAKKSKTGITGSKMPKEIKDALKDVDNIVQGANKLFNNRANIATLFLMSTCGIGYYGDAPGTALSKGFDTICKAGVTAVTEGVKGWISGMADKITLPSFMGDVGTGITGFVNGLVKNIVDKIVNAVISPIAEALAKLLGKAFDAIMEKIDLNGLFAQDTEAARRARQIYGAGVRIARAKSTIGKEVVTVKDMTSQKGYFLFTEKSAHANFKHLAYPQVVDEKATSDGYFVKGFHGWPPNSQGHAMVHVEINWPYESGWLFPVVSGRAEPSTENPPVATGHSMVFPQPNICNENLYSAGAKAFDPGSYTNAPPTNYEALEKEIKQYLKFVRFGMKYRIDDETLTLDKGGYAKYFIRELRDLWEFKVIWGWDPEFPVGGDYGLCWSDVTDGHSQDGDQYYLFKSKLNKYFDASLCCYYSSNGNMYWYWDYPYHHIDYFHWEGQHYKYKMTRDNGNAGLGRWYGDEAHKAYTADGAEINLYKISKESYHFFMDVIKEKTHDAFSDLYEKYAQEFGNLSTNSYFSESRLRQKIGAYADRYRVNVANMARWQEKREGRSYESWEAMDRKIRDLAEKSEADYPKIRDFIRGEIKELDDMISGKRKDDGSPEDLVVTPDEEEMLKDPDAGVNQATEKWNRLKESLKLKLAEVDDAVVALRESWTNYSATAKTFMKDREKCVPEYFIETCFKLILKKQSLTMFDGPELVLPDDVMVYNVYDKTKEMLALVEDYNAKLQEAYKREVEYGAMLGLNSAGQAQRSGKPLDEVEIGSVDPPPGDTPGTLDNGDDHSAIINSDHQEFTNGRWEWK